MVKVINKCFAGSWKIDSGDPVCKFCGTQWAKEAEIPDCSIPLGFLEELLRYRYNGSSMQALGKDTQQDFTSSDIISRYDIPQDELFALIKKYLITN